MDATSLNYAQGDRDILLFTEWEKERRAAFIPDSIRTGVFCSDQAKSLVTLAEGFDTLSAAKPFIPLFLLEKRMKLVSMISWGLRL